MPPRRRSDHYRSREEQLVTIGQAATALPKLRAVGTLVDERVSDLQFRFLRERRDSAAVAALARLRRGVGKPPGDLLDILEFTVLDEPLSRGDPADIEQRELAVHVAMTLYAVHQQSLGEPMHQRGQGLGRALRALHTGDPKVVPEPLVRRFRTLGTASSFTELAYHLRGAVQLLRAGTFQAPRKAVPLDYGRLADQLVTWQREGPSHVQMAWGREFYRRQRTEQPSA
jgi:CRISPR system Cascade subunit CasB